MILVTVGTEQYPFDRLMWWIDLLLEQGMIQEEVVVQYGTCTHLPAGARVYRTLKEERFQDLIQQARLVISHCGEGSVLLLGELAKPFILVPRSKTYQEHVDDHQVELAMALNEAQMPVAWTPGDLVRFLAEPVSMSFSHVSQKNSRLLCRKLRKRLAAV